MIKQFFVPFFVYYLFELQLTRELPLHLTDPLLKKIVDFCSVSIVERYSRPTVDYVQIRLLL